MYSPHLMNRPEEQERDEDPGDSEEMQQHSDYRGEAAPRERPLQR